MYVPVNQPKYGTELSCDTRAYKLLRGLRFQGECGLAFLFTRWKAWHT
ncbi:hypothetical protein ABH935_005449 [Catenulispora sp. GAS73]